MTERNQASRELKYFLEDPIIPLGAFNARLSKIIWIRPSGSEELEDLQALKLFSHRFGEELVKESPYLPFLSSKEISEYKEELLAPGRVGPFAGFLKVFQTMEYLQRAEETYPEMARSHWEEKIKPILSGRGLSLSDIAENVGVNFELLDAFDQQSVDLIPFDELDKICLFAIRLQQGES